MRAPCRRRPPASGNSGTVVPSTLQADCASSNQVGMLLAAMPRSFASAARLSRLPSIQTARRTFGDRCARRDVDGGRNGRGIGVSTVVASVCVAIAVPVRAGGRVSFAANRERCSRDRRSWRESRSGRSSAGFGLVAGRCCRDWRGGLAVEIPAAGGTLATSRRLADWPEESLAAETSAGFAVRRIVGRNS